MMTGGRFDRIVSVKSIVSEWKKDCGVSVMLMVSKRELKGRPVR